MKRLLCCLFCVLVTLGLFSCAPNSAPAPDPQGGTKVDAGEEKADYTALYAVLERVPTDLDAYTKSSAASLQAATQSIRYGLNASEQAQVDAFCAAIEEALSGLEERVRFSSISAIIEYVDALGIDFSDLASFQIDSAFDSILQKSADAGKEYEDETYYLGDSITLYMHRFSEIPSEHIYGVGSINPQNAAQDNIVTLENGTPCTFAEAMREQQPKRMVITIGTNSMLMDSLDYLTHFASLIEQLKSACPNAEIIVQSTSPLTAKYESGMRLLTNRNLNRANLLLAGLCVYEDVYFLNSASALKNAAGQLDERFDLGEGYGHINAAAYEIWSEYLRTHAVPQSVS